MRNAITPTIGVNRIPSITQTTTSSVVILFAIRAIFANLLSLLGHHFLKIGVNISVAFRTIHYAHMIWPKTGSRFASGYLSSAAKLIMPLSLHAAVFSQV